MRAWIKDALSQVKTKEQLHGILQELCGPYGPMVTTDVSCNGAEPGQVMCKIRVADHPDAVSLANWLGTTNQGNDIVLTYHAPSDFRC